MSIITNYITDLQETVGLLPVQDIEGVVALLYEAWRERRQVFIMGNGGSASTASHFVCDLSKNTRSRNHPPFRVIGLTDNMALMTAYANDEGYENVFAQQLAAFVQPKDIVIGISTSGRSPNVLNAIRLANKMEATTIGFTGFNGGSLMQDVDLNVHVDSTCIEIVEDIHLMLEHMICMDLRKRVQTTTQMFKV